MEATEVRKLAELEDRHWWYRERRILLRHMVADAFSSGTDGRVAVDVGAAGGGNTRVLRDLGMLAVPLEYGPEGAEVGRSRGLPAVRGDARQLPLADDAVDLVVAFDVLEHIEDDRSVLQEIRRVLRPGGWLFVAVPADMRLWSAHDDAVGHVRRYSREELESLVRASGLHIQNMWSWNVLLRPAMAIRRKKLTGSHLNEVHPILNLVLRGVIALERGLPYLRSRRGVSLMMGARRPED